MEMFSMSTASSVSAADIVECEIEILKTLKFKINFPTLNTFFNLFSLKWDTFIENNTKNINNDFLLDDLKISKHLKKFRENLEYNNHLFKKASLILDLIVLDIKYLQYNEKMIILSVFYLLIGLNLNIFTLEKIINFDLNFSLLEDCYEFNLLYTRFIQNYVEAMLELENMVECFKYTTQFFICLFAFNPVNNKNMNLQDVNKNKNKNKFN